MLTDGKSNWVNVGPSEMTALLNGIGTFFKKLDEKIYENISELIKKRKKAKILVAGMLLTN